MRQGVQPNGHDITNTSNLHPWQRYVDLPCLRSDINRIPKARKSKVDKKPFYSGGFVVNSLNRYVRPRPSEQTVVNQALRRARLTINRIQAKLRNSDPETIERVRLLFGSNASPGGISAGLVQIKRTLFSIGRKNNIFIDPEPRGNAVAYTLCGPSASIPQHFPFIMLQPYFFTFSHHSQANTLIHEAAHLALSVDDSKLESGVTAYGLLNAIQLASEDPLKAINNADNWALFVDGWHENF